MKLKLTKNQIKRLNQDANKYLKQLKMDIEDKEDKEDLNNFLVELDLAAALNRDSSFDVNFWLADNFATSDCRDAYKFSLHYQKMVEKEIIG
jgi:hypothetical protein